MPLDIDKLLKIYKRIKNKNMFKLISKKCYDVSKLEKNKLEKYYLLNVIIRFKEEKDYKKFMIINTKCKMALQLMKYNPIPLKNMNNYLCRTYFDIDTLNCSLIDVIDNYKFKYFKKATIINFEVHSSDLIDYELPIIDKRYKLKTLIVDDKDFNTYFKRDGNGFHILNLKVINKFTDLKEIIVRHQRFRISNYNYKEIKLIILNPECYKCYEEEKIKNENIEVLNYDLAFNNTFDLRINNEIILNEKNNYTLTLLNKIEKLVITNGDTVKLIIHKNSKLKVLIIRANILTKLDLSNLKLIYIDIEVKYKCEIILPNYINPKLLNEKGIKMKLY